jgi:hypothetical protein
MSAMGIGARLVVSALLLPALVSCTATARASDVYMALDAAGDRKRSVFFTDTKEIHCVVELGIGRKGATVETVVRQLQAYDFAADRFFATDRVIANVEASPTPVDGIQTLDVALKPKAPDGTDANDGPFLPGRFQCEAYLDGTLEQSAVFNIDFPECPASTIPSRAMCFGFYKQNLECPRYGLTSRDPAKCRCSSATGWGCE